MIDHSDLFIEVSLPSEDNNLDKRHSKHLLILINSFRVEKHFWVFGHSDHCDLLLKQITMNEFGMIERHLKSSQFIMKHDINRTLQHWLCLEELKVKYHITQHFIGFTT